MKALRFERHGDPDVLTIRELPRPEPDPGELLVEVHAAAVNPSDVKNVQGAMPQTKLPRTPGRDFAGVVVEGPENWKGAEVFGSSGTLGFTRDGSHAEYVVAPLTGVVRKPADISMVDASAIGVGFVAAWEGLVERAQLQAGETVLVVGGTGAVGTAVGQLARWSGAKVLSTTVSPGEADDSWRQTVDVVIDLSREDLAAAVLKATGGRGVDVVFNAVGGPTFAPSVKTLASGGRLVAIAAAEPREVSFNLFEFYRKDLAFYGLDTLALSDADNARILRRVVQGFANGSLRARVGRKLPLERAREAYEEVMRGAHGKVVLVMK